MDSCCAACSEIEVHLLGEERGLFWQFSAACCHIFVVLDGDAKVGRLPRTGLLGQGIACRLLSLLLKLLAVLYALILVVVEKRLAIVTLDRSDRRQRNEWIENRSKDRFNELEADILSIFVIVYLVEPEPLIQDEDNLQRLHYNIKPVRVPVSMRVRAARKRQPEEQKRQVEEHMRASEDAPDREVKLVIVPSLSLLGIGARQPRRVDENERWSQGEER